MLELEVVKGFLDGIYRFLKDLPNKTISSVENEKVSSIIVDMKL